MVRHSPTSGNFLKDSGRLPAGLALTLSSWFGAGYVPVAPGTAGSAAALPLAWLLFHFGGLWLLGLGVVLISAVGWWASVLAERHYAVHDSGHIVIDEVAGQLLTLLPVACSWPNLIVGFGFFRLFDQLKPWPAGWIDRQMTSGLGVMLDDLAAGVYAAGATALLDRLGIISWAVSWINSAT